MGDTLKDLTGKVFGNWTVIRRGRNIGKQVAWICKCSCGITRLVQGTSLKTGKSTSCGCKSIGLNHKTHGESKTRLFNIWVLMRQRCNNPHNRAYKFYGEKGVLVCREWNKFEPFRDWALSHGYKEGLSIDRIDVNGNYEPSNCRWIPQKEQTKNMTRNINVTINGKTQCLSEWVKHFDLPYNTVYNRIKHYGWTPEKALSTPIRKHKEYER